jgi:hypothetical protein
MSSGKRGAISPCPPMGTLDRLKSACSAGFLPVVDLYVSGLPEGGPVDVNAVRAAVPVAQRPHLDLNELHRALTGRAPLPHCVLSTPDPVEVARVRQLVRESVGAVFSRSDAASPSAGPSHSSQGGDGGPKPAIIVGIGLVGAVLLGGVAWLANTQVDRGDFAPGGELAGEPAVDRSGRARAPAPRGDAPERAGGDRRADGERRAPTGERPAPSVGRDAPDPTRVGTAEASPSPPGSPQRSESGDGSRHTAPQAAPPRPASEAAASEAPASEATPWLAGVGLGFIVGLLVGAVLRRWVGARAWTVALVALVGAGVAGLGWAIGLAEVGETPSAPEPTPLAATEPAWAAPTPSAPAEGPDPTRQQATDPQAPVEQAEPDRPADPCASVPADRPFSRYFCNQPPPSEPTPRRPFSALLARAATPDAAASSREGAGRTGPGGAPAGGAGPGSDPAAADARAAGAGSEDPAASAGVGSASPDPAEDGVDPGESTTAKTRAGSAEPAARQAESAGAPTEAVAAPGQAAGAAGERVVAQAGAGGAAADPRVGPPRGAATRPDRPAGAPAPSRAQLGPGRTAPQPAEPGAGRAPSSNAATPPPSARSSASVSSAVAAWAVPAGAGFTLGCLVPLLLPAVRRREAA